MELAQQKPKKGTAMTIKVVCADCGKKFTTEKDGETYNPANCPECNMVIGNADHSATSDDLVATEE